MRSDWRHVSTLFAVLAGALTPALLPDRAAAVDGITYASALSPSNSDATRTAEAFCPADTRAIGGGAIFSGSNRIIVEGAFPRERSFVVTAAEPTGGIRGDWYIVALAICAPERSLPGLERIEFISRISGETPKLASQSCSNGKSLIGMGGAIEGNSLNLGHLALTGIRTSTDLRTVTVQGGTPDGELSGGNWILRGVALCVNRVPEQQFVEAASALNATDRKSAHALCPSGTKIHSLGFDFTARRGELYATSLIPHNILATSGTQGVDVEAVEAGSGFVISGSNAQWLVRAQGICAR